MKDTYKDFFYWWKARDIVNLAIVSIQKLQNRSNQCLLNRGAIRTKVKQAPAKPIFLFLRWVFLHICIFLCTTQDTPHFEYPLKGGLENLPGIIGLAALVVDEDLQLNLNEEVVKKDEKEGRSMR